MILQSLYDYYQRKASDPESGIAPQGFEWKSIPFIVVIDRQGHFITLEDTREGEGKLRRPREFLVPAAEKRTVGINANLLWDNIEYALGANPRGREDIENRHSDFRQKLTHGLREHPDILALNLFLDASPITQIEKSAKNTELWKEILETNGNIVFRIDGSEYTSICQSLASNVIVDSEGEDAVCLVSGQRGSIGRIHPAIKGVRNAHSAGGSLLSFNLAAFRSYGKDQNYNSPVGNEAAFAYTTALNAMLGKNSKNRVQVGDASTVFWSERKTNFEDDFFSFWSVDRDDPNKGIKAVESLLKSPFTGSNSSEGNSRFFVLGLSPNAARISVRFWHSGTVSEFSEKIRQHFLDLKIVQPLKDKGSYALFFLLSDIAVEEKVDNIPPNLAGNVMRSILSGTSYPATLLQQAVRRIRAKREVRRTQAALLKAYLNRHFRFHKITAEEEITVALDSSNVNAGYRLGRLFAALEKIQEDAQPGINATIRDRFYGAASSSPVSVFPQLLKLKNHHLSKLGNIAFRTNHEKRLGEIFSGLHPDMPAHLCMEDQARFAIGYYHQRQAFFAKSDKPE